MSSRKSLYLEVLADSSPLTHLGRLRMGCQNLPLVPLVPPGNIPLVEGTAGGPGAMLCCASRGLVGGCRGWKLANSDLKD